MSNKTIRDGSGNIKYTLHENKLYNTTIVRDASRSKVASYSNKEPNLKTTTEKLKSN